MGTVLDEMALTAAGEANGSTFNIMGASGLAKGEAIGCASATKDGCAVFRKSAFCPSVIVGTGAEFAKDTDTTDSCLPLSTVTLAIEAEGSYLR